MLDTLISIIADWPIIVQGALGSALFWLILLLGQKAAVGISTQYAVVSRKRRKELLVEERAKYQFQSTKDHTMRAALSSVLLYRSFRTFLRSIVWLTLGLIGSNLDFVFGMVGYIGCLSYLFAALNTVRSVGDIEDPDAKIKELSNEIKKLEEKKLS